jgi:putative ABC transport system substrate-binding protein
VRAFSAFATDRPDGLVVLTEQRSIAHAKLLAELSRRERLPVLHSFSEGSTRAVSSPTVPTFRRWW